jgi:hypothetical protein
MNSTFEIIDMFGRQVYSQTISEEDADLVIPHIPPGYYTAVLTKGGKKQTKRLSCNKKLQTGNFFILRTIFTNLSRL